MELGEKEPMTGVDEGNVTYPEFYLLSEATRCLHTVPVLPARTTW